MSELKLRRLMEHNQRLREDLARPRVRVSEASARYGCLLFLLYLVLRIFFCLGVLTSLLFQSHPILQVNERSSCVFL